MTPREFKGYDLIDGEKWAVVKDRRLYSVSNLGRVRYEVLIGEYRMVNQHRFGAHMVVILSQAGEKKTIPVATLVANAFLGVKPKGTKTIHKDLDVTNNHADNLQYANKEEYCKYISRCHRELHGRTGIDTTVRKAVAERRAEQYADVVGRWTRREINIRQASWELGVSESAVSRWRSRHAQ